ncbi:MAG: O-antigen ligase family protein [Planctomycetota bacterium]|jgi:O-antigen ligase
MKAFYFLLRDIFSFEFFFLLFIFSGSYKANQNLAGLNAAIDLTLATSILSLLSGLLVFLYRPPQLDRRTIYYILVYMVFILFASTSYVFGNGEAEAHLKIKKLLVFNTWALLGPIIACRSRKRLARLVRLILVFSIIAASDSIIRFADVGTVGTFGGEGDHWLGRLSGLGLTIAIIKIVFGENRLHKPVYILMSCILFGAMMISGARQTLFGVAVVVLFVSYCLIFKKGVASSRLRYVKGLICIAGVLVSVYWVFASDPRGDRPIREAATIFRSAGIWETSRLLIWTTGLQMWRENWLLGVGFGSFRTESGLGVWKQPHNLFIEGLCELGIIGFLMITALVAVPLSLCWDSRRSQDPLRIAVAAQFLFLLTCAMFSGDITDNRLMLTFCGALMAHAALHSKPGN